LSAGKQALKDYKHDIRKHQIITLLELADYFLISREDPHLWFKLSYSLANKHVKAMAMCEPRGGARKENQEWDGVSLVGLEALYQISSQKIPDSNNRRQRFKSMKDLSKDTFMENIIASQTTDNLEKRYDERNKNPGYRGFMNLLDLLSPSDADHVDFFKKFLKNEEIKKSI